MRHSFATDYTHPVIGSNNFLLQLSSCKCNIAPCVALSRVFIGFAWRYRTTPLIHYLHSVDQVGHCWVVVPLKPVTARPPPDCLAWVVFNFARSVKTLLTGYAAVNLAPCRSGKSGCLLHWWTAYLWWKPNFFGTQLKEFVSAARVQCLAHSTAKMSRFYGCNTSKK
jgi:hypothetical protein